MYKKVFFPNLDGLRFIAFALVFLQHAFYSSFKQFENGNIVQKSLLSSFFLGGGTGVQIFFVLSGFLITYLILQEIESLGALNVKNFYIRRTLRIWPLYYAVVIFSFLIYPYLKSLIGINSDLCSRPFYYFTFLANFDVIHIAKTCPGKDAMTQGIIWSVAIEEQFYLVWPLFFKFLPKKFYSFLFLTVITGSVIFRLYYNGQPEAYFHTFAVMGDLAIGGLLAHLATYNIKFKEWIINLKQKSILISYLFILTFFIFNGVIFDFKYGAIVSRIFFDCVFAFVIVTQCFSANLPVSLGRSEAISNLGKVSYGLYMLHPVAMLVLDIAYRKLHLNNSVCVYGFLQGVLTLVLTIIIAKLSYKFLEKPFLKLKSKFSFINTERQTA
jgi:peptidoglycan/LPS O-acetylase OafA/YrhL